MSDISNTISIIGLGGEGIRALDILYEKAGELCQFVECDTDRDALESGKAPLKLYLCEDPQAIDVLLDSTAQRLFIICVLGGATASTYAPLLARKAKEKGKTVWAVIAIAPDKADEEAANFSYLELHDEADYVQMINSHLLSLCFLHRPKDKALMGILAQMLADETERLVTERIKVNSLFDEIKRKLDILLEEG